MTSSQSQPRREGSPPVQQRRLDEATADALRAHGGLGQNEWPISVVQVVETRGWDDEGHEYSDLHVYSTDGSTCRQVASLLRDAASIVTQPDVSSRQN